MGIRYLGLCQAVAVAKGDLLVVCNGYQVYGATSHCREKDLMVVYNGYQVCGVIPSRSRGNDGTAGGL